MPDRWERGLPKGCVPGVDEPEGEGLGRELGALAPTQPASSVEDGRSSSRRQALDHTACMEGSRCSQVGQGKVALAGPSSTLGE